MKKDIKIISLDLDGTLLDSQKRLSEGNRAALEEAAAKGVHIVPTTGRFFGMMPQAIRDLPFVRYAITINGAQVYDRETDTAIVREEIPLDMALDIIRLLDGYDVIYDCYRSNWGWMTESLQAKAEDYATDAHYLKMVREFRNPVPELKEYLKSTAAEGDVQKVMLFARNTPGSESVTKAITEAVAAHFPSIKTTSSTWNNLELNIATAHKGNSLKRFAEHLGYTLENCMALGDGTNDLSMIEAAGLGVAMSNAHPLVLAAADHVTTSNDEDGVAKAIRDFVL
ncbi:MAG: HAD family phosphatase [Kiritimatiellae bacterium]|nr:HAD family phosphatase [Kiritimatiellia bacterium]